MNDTEFNNILNKFKTLAMTRIDKNVQKKTFRHSNIYKTLQEYPSREGKGIRPALLISMCLAVGGTLNNALNTAAAIELFHNAFLVKDDIEDQSTYRRNEKTIVEKYGSSRAINIGDALAVYALKLLINNVEYLGVHNTLNIMDEILKMAIETVEGQSIELDWIAHNKMKLTERDYYTMCIKKTCWYTTITPCRIGCIIGLTDVTHKQLRSITKFSRYLGIGFQIQDDILNLISKNNSTYGKEQDGDLLEGKKTLMMIMMYNNSTLKEKNEIKKINSKLRLKKSQKDIKYLKSLMIKYDCIKKSDLKCKYFINKAIQTLDQECTWIENSIMKSFLRRMATYVIIRDK